MLVQLRCANGAVFAFDVHGGYVGEEERWWFETISTRGSTRLAPLRVVKELHGRPTDVSPRGAAARESAFIQSYRAELAHFAAVIAGRRGVRGAGRIRWCCTASSKGSTSRRKRGRRSGCDPVAPLARRRCRAAAALALSAAAAAAQTPRSARGERRRFDAGARQRARSHADDIRARPGGVRAVRAQRAAGSTTARAASTSPTTGGCSASGSRIFSSASSPATRGTGWAVRTRT